nr:hypothetical protein [Propionibacterium freudenreichii]
MSGACHSPHIAPLITSAGHVPSGRSDDMRKPRQPISSPTVNIALVAEAGNSITNCTITVVRTDNG